MRKDFKGSLQTQDRKPDCHWDQLIAKAFCCSLILLDKNGKSLIREKEREELRRESVRKEANPAELRDQLE